MGTNTGGHGVSTPFETMSHDQLRAWLHPANSDAVTAIADRLATAARTMHAISADLKAHMSRVGWQGEAGDAFRTWGTDTANATARLANYSAGAAKWLSIASETIAEVKSAMPYDKGSPKANLASALSHPNSQDPATAAWAARTTLVADEGIRQAAIRQMRKLAGAYAWAASGLKELEVPRFPAPPGEFVPANATAYGSQNESYGSVGEQGSPTSSRYHAQSYQEGPSGGGASYVPPSGAVQGPVGTEVDSVAAPPQRSGLTASTPSDVSASTRSDGSQVVPGSPALMHGPAAPGNFPGDAGIHGGRAVPRDSARSGGIPRGTVVGAEGTHRAPSGQRVGGPVVGSPANGHGSVTGGRSQQSGPTVARPFTPGASGSMRSAGHGELGHGGIIGPLGSAAGASGAGSRSQARSRPDYLSEDKETWQAGDRRVVPPVIE